MSDSRASSGLQTLFSIFLGLMVTAFIGVGVFTFYSPPAPGARDRIIRLERDEQALRNARPADSLTAADRARLQEITDERNRVQDESRKAMERWYGRTSIILVALATLTMGVSLTLVARLPVISSGLLMGGVFTMIYGVGWVIVSGTSAMRFVVMSIAFAITLTLGYLRFVRGRTPAPVRANGGTTPMAGLADLEQRVGVLEERLTQAANALATHKR